MCFIIIHICKIAYIVVFPVCTPDKALSHAVGSSYITQMKMLPENTRSSHEWTQKFKANFITTVLAVVLGNYITEGCNGIRDRVMRTIEAPAAQPQGESQPTAPVQD